MKFLRDKFESIIISWSNLYIFTFIAAHLYVFFEWVFIISKPSSLNAVPFFRKVEILLFTCTLLTSLLFVGLSIFLIFFRFLRNTKLSKIIFLIGCLLPVSVIASLVLILIDNFSYTIFKFGIISTSGFATGLYLLSFLFIMVFIFMKTIGRFSKQESVTGQKRKKKIILPAILLYLVLALVLTYKGNDFKSLTPDIDISQINKKLPNIVIITGDGIDASHTSAYGYEFDTTPNLKELAKTSLVAENAFTNAGNTAGSLISMYTSKYPTATRVLYPPDILKNIDSYQHLPGILKYLGYYTEQLSFPYYADAYALNLLNGFDTANGRRIERSPMYNIISSYVQSDYADFLYETSNRIVDRLRHIFFIKRMVNQFDLVTGSDKIFEDITKIKKTEKLLAGENQPTFVHIHWMGTHSLGQDAENQKFTNSRNVDTPEKMADAIYDDKILEFDNGIGEFINDLKKKGLFNNTILIITTDHNRNKLTTNKIPLLIHFPNDQYAGTRKSDIQIMDIAPTLLDYMGIAKPSYMQGSSFLRDELGNRPIFATGITDVNAPIHPPFYQFSYISVVYCNEWYKFNTTTYEYETGLVEGDTEPCGKDATSTKQVTEWIVDHLDSEGFDTTGIVNHVSK